MRTDPGWFIHQLEVWICMTFNFLYSSFSTLYCSSLWRTVTIVFAKLNKPPFSPPRGRGGEGPNKKFTVLCNNNYLWQNCKYVECQVELNLLLGRGMLQASKDWLMDGPLFHQKKKVKTFGDYLKLN